MEIARRDRTRGQSPTNRLTATSRVTSSRARRTASIMVSRVASHVVSPVASLLISRVACVVFRRVAFVLVSRMASIVGVVIVSGCASSPLWHASPETSLTSAVCGQAAPPLPHNPIVAVRASGYTRPSKSPETIERPPTWQQSVQPHYQPSGPTLAPPADSNNIVGDADAHQGQFTSCTADCPVLLGVDEHAAPPCREPLWSDARPIPFQMFFQGEYIGPHRDPHVPEYRLRVGDQLELVFRKTVEPSGTPYRLNVGDQIRIQSYVDPNLDTTVTIQPDGMITLRLLHQVRAEGRTISELEEALETLYKQYYKKPTITVTPVQLETKLNELRASVDSRFGFGGQGRRAVVAPDGTIQLPALGSVPAQGLTIDELKREIDERYRTIVHGMEVTPVLAQIAPRFVYVLGEVPRPGRYDLAGPTTVMQALSMAGGWQIGGNLRQIVIFRRTDDWRLIATRVDLRGALYGKRPNPADELWVRDSDVIVVPKAPIQVADDVINLVFTQGIYRVLPNPSMSVTFFRNSIL